MRKNVSLKQRESSSCSRVTCWRSPRTMIASTRHGIMKARNTSVTVQVSTVAMILLADDCALILFFFDQIFSQIICVRLSSANRRRVSNGKFLWFVRQD
jgi:hypothetical protein